MQKARPYPSENTVQQILDGDPVPTFVIDAEHKITHWNRACEAIIGMPADTLIGTNLQWKPFYAEPRPVMADLVISGAIDEKLTTHYQNSYRRSQFIPGAYEAEGFFPHMGEKGRWLYFTAAPIKDVHGNITGAIETLQDISERKLAEEGMRQANAALAEANEKLKRNFLTSIKTFTSMGEMREGQSAGHSRRIADQARKLAHKLGLIGPQAQDVFLAAMLHDIGKVGFSDALLAKPVSKMDGEEMEIYRKHPLKGEAALMPLEELRAAARLVRSHHERFDGLGFPDKLKEQAIPLGARILAVISDYDDLQIGAMVEVRMGAAEARTFLQQSRGKRYDPQVVDAFIEILGVAEKESGSVESKLAQELALTTAGLKPGMVLARDLLTRDGALLLAADYVLDEALIRQICGYEKLERVRLAVHIRP